MSDQPLPATRRHSFRISVRGLIVLVLAAGGWLGWIANSAESSEAVAAIRRAGGGVVYEWRYPGGDFDPKESTVWPEWILARFGEDYFYDVAEVNLFGKMAPDDDLSTRDRRRIAAALAQIGYLRRLVILNLQGTDADDHALAGLRQLTRLRYLDLNGTRITDATILRGIEG